jgi:hypothetical protein
VDAAEVVEVSTPLISLLRPGPQDVRDLAQLDALADGFRSPGTCGGPAADPE